MQKYIDLFERRWMILVGLFTFFYEYLILELFRLSFILSTGFDFVGVEMFRLVSVLTSPWSDL